MGCLVCVCSCAFITDTFSGSSTTTVTGWTEEAGDWSKGSNVVTTSSSDAILLNDTENDLDPQSSKVTIVCSPSNVSIGNQYRWIVAAESADDWIGVQWEHTDTIDSTAYGSVTFLQCTAGVVSPVGDSSANLYLPDTIQWDGTYLIIGDVYGGGVNYDRFFETPTTGFKVGLGSGSNAGSTDVAFASFNAYYHRDDRSNCERMAFGCAHCSIGEWSDEWSAEFTNFQNRNCDKCEDLNSMAVVMTCPGAPYYQTNPLGGSPIELGCHNAQVSCHWGGAQVPNTPTTGPYYGASIVCPDTIFGGGDANKSMLWHRMSINYYDPQVVDASQDDGPPFVIPLTYSGKWLISYCIFISLGGIGNQWGCGPTYSSGPLDSLDCTGATSYQLNYFSGSGWQGCYINVGEYITVTPTNGEI